MTIKTLVKRQKKIKNLTFTFNVKQKVNHGIPNTLHAISKKNGLVRKHNLYSSIVSAAFTVGFGGSAGLEGPTVGTTSAWGANIGTLFKLPYKTRSLLIGCAS